MPNMDQLTDPIEKDELISDVPPAQSDMYPDSGPGISEKIMDFLTTETGEGEINDYVNHPLNIWQSSGVAQMIRGITGFVGNNLRLAVVDIVFGYFRYRNEQLKGAGSGVGTGQA